MQLTPISNYKLQVNDDSLFYSIIEEFGEG